MLYYFTFCLPCLFLVLTFCFPCCLYLLYYFTICLPCLFLVLTFCLPFFCTCSIILPSAFLVLFVLALILYLLHSLFIFGIRLTYMKLTHVVTVQGFLQEFHLGEGEGGGSKLKPLHKVTVTPLWMLR